MVESYGQRLVRILGNRHLRRGVWTPSTLAQDEKNELKYLIGDWVAFSGKHCSPHDQDLSGFLLAFVEATLPPLSARQVTEAVFSAAIQQSGLIAALEDIDLSQHLINMFVAALERYVTKCSEQYNKMMRAKYASDHHSQAQFPSLFGLGSYQRLHNDFERARSEYLAMIYS